MDRRTSFPTGLRENRGSAIAAAVSVAYRFGLDALIKLAINEVTKLVVNTAGRLMNRGFSFLVRQIRPLRNFMNALSRDIMKLRNFMRAGT